MKVAVVLFGLFTAYILHVSGVYEHSIFAGVMSILAMVLPEK